MDGNTRVRGIAFENLVGAARALYGVDVAERLRREGTGLGLEHLRAGTLDTTAFYPITELAENERALAKLVGGGDEVAFAIGQFALEDHLPRVFRLFLRVLHPGFVLDRGTSIMRRYFDRGHLEVTRRGAHEARLVARDLPGFDATLWADFRGATTATLSVAGARGVEVALVEGGEADHASFVARWR
ncbi:MAG: DUF2378 family protein [Sandaracinus sp.]|nr:DUF2378 family protein [Sandaracinus sp.]